MSGGVISARVRIDGKILLRARAPRIVGIEQLRCSILHRSRHRAERDAQPEPVLSASIGTRDSRRVRLESTSDSFDTRSR
eukprot:7383427-Prymnesium_polylepis.1